jgi:hypothetical protein
MKLLIVGTSDDVEVTMGLRMLLDQRPVTEVVLPIAEENETHDQVILAASERGLAVTQGGSLEDLLMSVSKDDIVAIAWDDSDEAFEAVLTLQDRKIQAWDISDGLSLIDMETEILEERLSEVLEDFVESLTAIVYKMVMDQVNGEGKWKYRRPDVD